MKISDFRNIMAIIMLILMPILGIIGLAWTVIKELAIIEILRNIIGG
jgi:hypothetical protein